MKNTIIAFVTALVFAAFTPVDVQAKDHHKKKKHHHHDHDRYRYSYHHDRHYYHDYDHDYGHHYGHQRVSFRPGHYTWVNHHRVWVPPARVVVYF